MVTPPVELVAEIPFNNPDPTNVVYQHLNKIHGMCKAVIGNEYSEQQVMELIQQIKNELAVVWDLYRDQLNELAAVKAQLSVYQKALSA